jgi:hypothetical protein
MANFLQTLENIGHGALIERLEEELAAVVEAVAETTKPGELSLKLTIKFDAGLANVTAEVKSKAPRHGVPGSIFHFGERGDGRLHREDPRQLPLKGLDRPERPLKSIEGGVKVDFPTDTEPPEAETNGNGTTH